LELSTQQHDACNNQGLPLYMSRWPECHIAIGLNGLCHNTAHLAHANDALLHCWVLPCCEPVVASFPSMCQSAELYPLALQYIQSGGDPTLKKPTQAQQLEYYALFKQATVGKCNEKQPSRFKVIARAKHDAWSKLGNMSKEDAKRAYVTALTKADPNWQTKATKLKSKL